MGRGRPNVESKGLAHLEATHNLFVSGTLSVSGSAVISDLTVLGMSTTISSSDLLVQDPLIVVGLSQSGPPTFDTGIIHERGDEENVGIIWDESEDEFALIRTPETGSTSGNVPITGYRNLKASNILLSTGSIIAQGADLILSSSSGSIFASASLVQCAGGFDAVAGNISVGSSNQYSIDGGPSLRKGSGTNARFHPAASPSERSTVELEKVTNDVGHLILSSSAGSTIHVSGALVVEPGHNFALSSRFLVQNSSIISYLQHNFRNKIVADQSHLIFSSSAGSVIYVSGALSLPQVDDVSFPTIQFGDGDTGIFEEVDDTLVFAHGGSEIWRMSSLSFGAIDAGSRPAMRNEVASDVNPTLLPVGSDTDTGVGSAGANQLSLIAGNVEALRLDSAGQLIASSQHLVLSSSVGSQVTVSGNLVVLDDRVYFGGLESTDLQLRANGPNLEIRGGTNSVTSIGLVKDITSIGQLNFTSDKQYFVNASNAHLILSSSAGSQVTASGTLFSTGPILTNTTLRGATLRGSIHNGVDRITMNTTDTVFYKWDSADSTNNEVFRVASGSDNNGHHLAVSGNIISTSNVRANTIQSIGGSGIVTNAGIWVQGGNIRHSGHLILSSSVGSQVTVSGNLHIADNSRLLLDPDQDSYLYASSDDTVALALSNINYLIFSPALTTVRNVVTNDLAHLVLSSSAGSQVTVSGNLRIPVNHSIILDTDGNSTINANVNNFIDFNPAGTTAFRVTNTGNRSELDLDMRGNTLKDTQSHLIFSSSAGSQVTVSGTLQVGAGLGGSNSSIIRAGSDRILFEPEGASGKAHIRVQGIEGITSTNGYQLGFYNAGLGLGKAAPIWWTNSGPSSAKNVEFSRNDTTIGLLDMSGSSGSVGFIGTSGPLILSSSTSAETNNPNSDNGVVTISGTLKLINDDGTEFNNIWVTATSGQPQLNFRLGGSNIFTLTTTSVQSNQNIVLGGSGDNATLSALNEHLILSSSAGSQVTVSGNLHLSNNGRLILDQDKDAYISATADDIIQFYTAGAEGFRIENTKLEVRGGRTFSINAGILTDLAGILQVGGATSTNHSLGIGDTVFANDAEVNGALYCDAGAQMSGTLVIFDAGLGGGNILEVHADDGSPYIASFERDDVTNAKLAYFYDSAGNFQFRNQHATGDIQFNTENNSTPKVVFDGVTGNVVLNKADSTLYNANSHLILSSSAGSQITVSGSMQILSGATGNSLLLPQKSNPSEPTLAFGDGDTGFYEEADDEIVVALAGNTRWEFVGTQLRGYGGTGPSLERTTPSATNPSIHPFGGDAGLDTGIGRAGEDELSLIAGGLEGIRITEDGTSARVAITGSVRDVTGDPPSPIEGEFQINNFDKSFKVYASGSWRTITTW